MSWPEQDGAIKQINGERRFDRRYDIALDLRWKVVRRRKVLDSGTGQTVDLSSGGIRFQSGRPLPVGLGIELAIAWPALLHNTAPMQLVVHGKVVRTNGSETAIHTLQHEFRTAGASAGQRLHALARTCETLQ
jgi:c-di-GMP-binding flagellar brake protein YcgR